ncbi:MAG: acyl-ACP--UDP-N-acetylglucosamine O-acyltransferase [Saprospiraceae bacterium]|nr:acyl-ACP--UDP-N-acetylglucosamine O-acyltransferase [Saprospiraceae bacterium]
MEILNRLCEIDTNAKIADNVEVGSFTVIAGDVEIGEGTWIGPHVTIMDGARIGKNCKIHPGAVISGIPQDLKFKGEYSTVEIGDNTSIRECVTINRGTVDRNKTVVGSNTLIMAYVHLGHDCFIGNSCIISNAVQMAGHVEMDDFAIIGGSCAVQQFVHIGAHTYIGGGSLVRKNVPPYVKAAREPLSYAGVNSTGLQRRGYSQEDINKISDIYRILFVKGYNVSAAIDVIQKSIPDSIYKTEILDFISNSPTGIIREFRPVER